MKRECINCDNGWIRSPSDLERNGNRGHIVECLVNDRVPYKLPHETCEKWKAKKNES